MNKKKSDVTSVSSAENGANINAVKEEAIGKPHSGETVSPAAGEEKNKEAEFEKLIKGQYKEEFASRVKKIIDRRLKEVKQLKENADKNARIVDMLSEHYNVEKGNTDELERVINENMNRKEQDTSKELYNSRRDNIIRKLAAENLYLKRKQAEELRRAKIQERISAWKEQAKEAAKVYPDFELEEEMKNDTFRNLIGSGVNVKQAYEVVHLDSILADNSKTAEKKVITSIRSKANRPVENGSGSSGGILISSDVSKLTPKERAELAKRASRGEKIEF